MDQYHRPVLTAEEKFFDECNTGNGKFHCTLVVKLSLTFWLQYQLWFCSQNVMHCKP